MDTGGQRERLESTDGEIFHQTETHDLLPYLDEAWNSGRLIYGTRSRDVLARVEIRPRSRVSATQPYDQETIATLDGLKDLSGVRSREMLSEKTTIVHEQDCIAESQSLQVWEREAPPTIVM